MLRWACLCAAAVLAALASGAAAREYVVDVQHPQAADENPGSPDRPLKTVGKAAQLVKPGDTVLVRPGVYRESVRLRQSGTAEAPIAFAADPPGQAIITGADVVTGWQKVEGAEPIYRVAWPHMFIVGHASGKPVEHHPADAPLWGRAEQAIADGKQLLPAASLGELRRAWQAGAAARKPGSPVVVPPPLANLGGPFAGMFAVDTEKKEMYVWLADGGDPAKHQMEASARGQTFGVNQWQDKAGVRFVHVRNFVFRYGASFPQRAVVSLHGAHNVLENCIVEQMAGTGVTVDGTMRRTIVRGCGHTGGGAQGDGFLNEDCLWEGNSWKPINRQWDSAGFKVCLVDGGVFRRCAFRRNGGPGLWFDIHVRNVLVTECVFEENEESGLFIEISRDVQAINNLAVGNATGAVGDARKVNWGTGGIKVAESANCVIAGNTCVGNKDGITMREQGPRPLQTDDFGLWPYHNQGHVIAGNVCALNKGYQLALWYDNGFFGPHPSEKQKYKTPEEFEAYLRTVPDKVYDPTRQGLTIDRNLYFAGPGQSLILYGCPWRPKHEVFTDLAAFAAKTGFDVRSRVADPQFLKPDAGDYRFSRDGPAWAMQAGWLLAPAGVAEWTRALVAPLK